MKTVDVNQVPPNVTHWKGNVICVILFLAKMQNQNLILRKYWT